MALRRNCAWVSRSWVSRTIKNTRYYSTSTVPTVSGLPPYPGPEKDDSSEKIFGKSVIWPQIQEREYIMNKLFQEISDLHKLDNLPDTKLEQPLPELTSQELEATWRTQLKKQVDFEVARVKEEWSEGEKKHKENMSKYSSHMDKLLVMPPPPTMSAEDQEKIKKWQSTWAIPVGSDPYEEY